MPADARLNEVVGKVRLERVLGEGGFGVVYAGTHELTGRRVAVKMLHPQWSAHADFRERFLREARVAASLEHPNVVDVLDMGEAEDGSLFLVLEFLDGVALSDRLQRETLSAAAALSILLPIMDALASAHDAGIVHRDLKPENIFLARIQDREVPKLLDFGIAQVAGEERLTQTGQQIGTPLYMSPEQLKAMRALGPPSDVWSMAVVAYELLSNRHPWDAPTPGAMAIAVHTEPPRPLAEVAPRLPAALTEAVHAALVVAPEARPTMRAFAESLAPFAGLATMAPARETGAPKSTGDFATGPTELGPATPPPRAVADSLPREANRSRPVAAWAIGALLLAGAAGGGLWWSTRAAPDDPVVSRTEVASETGALPANPPAPSEPEQAPSTEDSPATSMLGASESLSKLAVIWRRLPAEQRALPLRFIRHEQRWVVVADSTEAPGLDAMREEFGGELPSAAPAPTAPGLRPHLARTNVRLNVREQPSDDSSFGHVLPHDAVVVALEGDVDGHSAAAPSGDEDADEWSHFIASREERGWGKARYLTPYAGCVAIPRRLVAAHPDAARAVRTSFQVSATHVYVRGRREPAYLMSASAGERTFLALHAIEGDCGAGEAFWSHAFEGALDELFLSDTEPDGGATLVFASVGASGQERRWRAWALDDVAPVWTRTLDSGGTDPPDGLSGTRDRALRGREGAVMVRRGRERELYEWSEGRLVPAS